MKKGFTLVEVLMAVAVVSILAIVTVVIINPAELFRQGRDANRVTDLGTLNKAVSLYYSDAMNNPNTLFMGTSSVLYVSIPDPTASAPAGNQCTGLSLPTPPTGFIYHCAAPSTYLKTDGTGWLPINLNSYAAGSVISKLPVDPTNTTSTNLYYTYETDGIGGFKIAAFFESAKDAPLMASDGGNDAELYEKGSNLALATGRGLMDYWPFDEGVGTTAYDHSGNNSTVVFSGSTAWVTGKVGSAINLNNTSSVLTFQTASSALPTSSITVALWENTNGFSNYADYLVNNWTIGAGSWILFSNIGQSLYWGITGPAAATQNTSVCPGVLTSNTWQFLVGTYDGTTIRTYLNGALCGTATLSAQTLWTGNYLGNNTGASGNPITTDDIRVYNRALSAAEIQEMYNAEK